jgi:putative DNA primase/helicase
MIFPEVMRNEICRGYTVKAVTQLLIQRGLLLPEGSGANARADRKERLPGVGSARCYRFTSGVVSAGD